MNSRERVIASLERRRLDRVPLSLDCGGSNSAVEKLCHHFKANNADELMSKMNIDLRVVQPSYIGPPERAFGSASENMASVFGGTEYMRCDYAAEGGIAGTYSDSLGIRPLKDCTTIREIDNYPWPKVEWFDFSTLRRDCRRYKGYAIRIGGWAPLLSRVFELFGMQTTFVNMRLRPNLIHAVLRRATDFYYDFYDTALSSVDGKIDIVGFGDDFATQEDLMISPEMWRSFLKQHLTRLFGLGDKHDVYVSFHSCGAVRKIIPDLVEAGLNILFPMQPRARQMDHAELKAEFGENLAFWGGVDVQRTLPFGTPEDVRYEVRECIRILGAGGGYVLSSSHNLLKHFPLENILAMYDEAIETRPTH